MTKILIPKGVNLYFKSPSGETQCALHENYLAITHFASYTNAHWFINQDVKATMLLNAEKIDFTLTKGDRIWIKFGEESPQGERIARQMKEEEILRECEETGRKLPLKIALRLFERELRISTKTNPSKIYMTKGTKMEFLKEMAFVNAPEVIDEVEYLLSFEGYYTKIIIDNNLPHGDFRIK